MRALATVFGIFAAVWGILTGASTVFPYLVSARGWDTTFADIVSLPALPPGLGGTVAAFMAGPLTGWTFWHAFFNFNGWIILLVIGGLGTSKGKKVANASSE